jgi:hypothetical protein
VKLATANNQADKHAFTVTMNEQSSDKPVGEIKNLPIYKNEIVAQCLCFLFAAYK